VVLNRGGLQFDLDGLDEFNAELDRVRLLAGLDDFDELQKREEMAGE
jgi:hypothetical protein